MKTPDRLGVVAMPDTDLLGWAAVVAAVFGGGGMGGAVARMFGTSHLIEKVDKLRSEVKDMRHDLSRTECGMLMMARFHATTNPDFHEHMVKYHPRIAALVLEGENDV